MAIIVLSYWGSARPTALVSLGAHSILCHVVSLVLELAVLTTLHCGQ